MKQPELPLPLTRTCHPHPDGGLLPDWIADELAEDFPARYLAAARWCRCRKCGEVIVTGLDDPHFLAGNAAVDPTPLTPQTELACVLTGRATYRLHLTGSSVRITPRDRWNMAHPAGARGKPAVVPAHQCGARFPGFAVPAVPTAPEATNDAPPF